MNPRGFDQNNFQAVKRHFFHIYKAPTVIVNAVVPSLVHKPSTQMTLLTCMPARTPRCFQCLMYGSLYREEKVNCFSVCPFERPPEAVQDIKSRHARSHYACSSLIKPPATSPATHTHWGSGWFTQQQHLLTTRGHYHNFYFVRSVLLSVSQEDTLLFNTMFFSNCPFFSQAKYWNSSVNEVEGTITDSKGKVIHKLFGKWNEAVFCGDPPSATCIWRARMFVYKNALRASLQCTSPYHSI